MSLPADSALRLQGWGCDCHSAIASRRV